MSTDAIGSLAGLFVAVAVLIWFADSRRKVMALAAMLAVTSVVLRLAQLWLLAHP